MATLSSLPLEVVELIVTATELTVSELTQLALISRRFDCAVRTTLYTHPTLTSSTQLNTYLASIQLATSHKPTSPTPHHSRLPTRLSLARGARTRPVSQTTGKGKARRTETVQIEDAITEDDVLRVLTAVGSGLVELRMIELGFATLRRRQLGFVGHLAGLRSLTVTGRPTLPFNLHTLGQILTATPLLTSLSLSHIHPHPSALHSLPPPTFHLTHLSLISTPPPLLTRAHLKWLLRPSSLAESLRHLALEWDGPAGPALHAVRYAALRVKTLAITTRTPGLVESLVMHLPMLEGLEVRAGCGVDAARLVGNLEWPLKELVDWGREGEGLGRSGLAWVIGSGEYQFARELERVEVGVVGSGDQEGDELLRVACAAKGVQLVLH